jgi:predicted metal-binding membrane protein
MTTPVASTRPQAPTRGPARAVWAIAGICWVVTIAILLVGADGLGHHDVVLEQSGLTWPSRLAAFTAVWLVMVGAMMLPTVVPMLELFWVVSGRQPHPAHSRAAVVAAYLVVWSGFALIALAGDAIVHQLVDSWSWLAARPGLVLGSTLVLAGAFQFSSLKKACLTQCRSPLSLLWQHYRRGLGGAWALGFRHALLCLGCCWALMLVMFATGTGSLGWMLLLAGVMVAEKTTSWGARLVAPAGLALIAGGLAVAGVALFTPI